MAQQGNPGIPPAPPAVQVPPPVPVWLQQATALGLIPGEQILFELMTNFHTFSMQQYVCLRDLGGYGTLEDLNQWQHKDIKEWCKSMSALAVNRGGRTFGDLKIKQLQGIAWWVSDCFLRRVTPHVAEYKADADNYRINAELDYRESKSKDTIKVDKPEKFDYKKWIEWEVSVYMYFDSVKNLKGVPISYVIRKGPTVGQFMQSRKEQIINNAPLTGYLYEKDNATVGNIIKEVCLGTEAESWIKNIVGGREAMRALQLHYDGPDEARKRLSVAKAQLEKLFYRHEATFSFEKYVTALNDIYNIHERYQEPIFESDKVRYLLEKCQNNHAEFKQTIVLCRSQHTTFTGAVTMLKEACGRLFADAHVKSNRHKRSIANVNTKNNNYKGNKKMVNGVDTSDLSRWYTNEEMKKLPNWLQKKIATNKDHQNKNKDKIHEKKKARVNVSAINTDENNNNGSNSSPSNDSNSIIAGVINGMHNAQRQGGHQFPLNGRSASVAAANRNRSGGIVDDSSVVTFDHLGNPV